ncbi:MAG: MATE family efflux transporter [Turicibacter sp.]|nr:MATE family efflux transporter [Turicibacter sp.]
MPETKEVNLSEKEAKLRDFILNDSMFKVILKIGLPIAFFQGLNNLLRILDAFMATSIDSTAASMVTYFGQMNLIINALGLGLATGATLKISQMYGKGDYATVKKQISSLFAFAGIFCLALLVIVAPLATPILRMMNAPAEFITLGRNYFLIELFSTMITIWNAIYIALERVQGNAKRILYMNLVAMAIRLSLTAFSVYILREGITFIAISTLLSQSFIFVYGLYNLMKKSDVFTISVKEVSFKRKLLWPMIGISIPIMIERSAFHVGKTVVNAMITTWGSLVVGGLGISNLICGVSVAPQMGMQDASISVMAQNLGAAKVKRVIEAFKAVLVINVIQATLFFLPSFIFARQITGLFAIGDPMFHDILYAIYLFDVWSILALSAYNAVMALLFGLGYTKLTLFLNFCRIFLFRIPVLLLLQHFTNMQEEAAGFVMVFSNISVSLLGVVIGIICLIRLCRKHEISFWETAK